MYKSTHS